MIRFSKWSEYQNKRILRGQGPVKFVALHTKLLDSDRLIDQEDAASLIGVFALLLCVAGRTRNEMGDSVSALARKCGLPVEVCRGPIEQLGKLGILDGVPTLGDLVEAFDASSGPSAVQEGTRFGPRPAPIEEDRRGEQKIAMAARRPKARSRRKIHYPPHFEGFWQTFVRYARQLSDSSKPEGDKKAAAREFDRLEIDPDEAVKITDYLHARFERDRRSERKIPWKHAHRFLNSEEWREAPVEIGFGRGVSESELDAYAKLNPDTPRDELRRQLGGVG